MKLDRDCRSTRSSAGVRPRKTVGDDQIGSCSRWSRQRVWPSDALIPATNDSPAFCTWTITVSPTTSGEEAMPTLLRAVGHSYDSPRSHWGLPSRSKQARSLEENRAKIRRPSLAGVLAAMPPNGLWIVLPVAQSCRCQRTLPDTASKASTCSRSCLGPLAAVTTTRPATTIGPAGPRPGSDAFQATCSSGPKRSGRSFSSPTLVLSLPRNWSQSAPQNSSNATATIASRRPLYSSRSA